MRNFLIPLLLFLGMALKAEETTNGLAELYADRFVSEGDRVEALGHVVLSYDGTLFLGDRARYDRQKNVIVLEGNVEILSNRGSKVLADKVVFEVEKNHVTFSDFYQSDREDIWIYADDAQKQDGNYSLHNSILSSCSVKDPDWSIRFDEAFYDSERKYIRLKSVKVYAGDVPVFYTPYFGFSLERQRHSGFLMPHFGLSGDEGFYYEQPYYWAISDSMDLELNPSVRSERGVGIYGTFRFADTPWSGGTIRTGFFGDNDRFTRTHNLANSSHYGLEVLYESSNFLQNWKPEGYRDGFYLNLNLFNDIDYQNLQFSTLNHLEETSRFKESRLNYFLYDDSRYFGLRSRYFIDTTSSNNNGTIQELPALQYHQYAAPIFDGLFDYSVDTRLYNLWREEGTRALRGEVTLPVEFHTVLLDDYLNLNIREELAASDTKFFENSFQVDQDHYAAAVLHHNIELSGDLIRGYEHGTHTMTLSALFTKTSLLAEGDLRYDEINDEIINDYNLDMIYDTRLAFKMHHFWQSYDSSFTMDYLAVADYYPEDDSKWNVLSQELHLNYGYYTFSSRLDYSIYRHSLVEFTNSFEYSDQTFGLKLEHTRRESSLYETEGDWEYSLDQHELSLNARYRANDMMTWYGGYTYDFKEESAKDWHAGILFDRKCWNFKVVFEQEITPVLTKEGEGSIRENKVYFQFNLVPFGGVGSGRQASL